MRPKQRVRLVVAAGCVTLAILVAGCSALREMKEKQQPFASGQVKAAADDVYAAVLSVLPEFHLIVTARYDDQRFFEARGEWETPSEGAVVHVSVQDRGAISTLKIDAGPSDYDSPEPKRELAQAIMTRVEEILNVEVQAP